jgi:hypothetical protein
MRKVLCSVVEIYGGPFDTLVGRSWCAVVLLTAKQLLHLFHAYCWTEGGCHFVTLSVGIHLKVSMNHAMSVSTEPCDKARLALDWGRARL